MDVDRRRRLMALRRGTTFLYMNHTNPRTDAYAAPRRGSPSHLIATFSPHIERNFQVAHVRRHLSADARPGGDNSNRISIAAPVEKGSRRADKGRRRKAVRCHAERRETKDLLE